MIYDSEYDYYFDYDSDFDYDYDYDCNHIYDYDRVDARGGGIDLWYWYMC